MHLLSEIEISNYRSIRLATFPLSAFTPLVGYNNVGKSNILSAISWLVKKQSLSTHDFNNPSAPLFISGTIRGITSHVLASIDKKHRDKISPFISDGTLQLRRTQLVPNAKPADIRLEVLDPNKNDGEWQANPADIDAAISYLFPDPILIGAMEDVTEDVGKFGTSITIGKLIKEIISPVIDTHSDTLSASLATIADKLSADGNEKDPTLSNLDLNIARELEDFFPGVYAKIHIATPNFSDLIKSATIRVFEDHYTAPGGRDPSSFGHGAQRSIQLALIKCLAQIRRGAATGARTTLLLIDEPELYLHPQAIEALRASLSRLSGDDYQVIFTTHSPAMINKSDAPSALLIRRDSKNGSHALPRMSDLVRKEVSNAKHQSDVIFDLSRSAQFLFSERVLLCEGKTESTLLPDLYALEFKRTLGEDKIGLIALSGSPNIPGALRVLKAMGIPTKVAADLDFAFKIAPKAGRIPANDSDIRECVAVLRKLERDGLLDLDQDGFPRKSDRATAAKGYEILAMQEDAAAAIGSLHTKLLKSSIWVWSRGTIESHLGLASKDDAAHVAFLRSISEASFLKNIVHYRDVVRMLEWSRE